MFKGTKILFFSIIVTFSPWIVQASDFFPPPPINTSSGLHLVFTDFQKALYQITYDVATSKVSVESFIDFSLNENGYPVFDSVNPILNAELNGDKVEVKKYDLTDVTTFLYLNRSLPAGLYHLKLKTELKDFVLFNKEEGSVQSAFWMGDLSDRNFLERYLPSSFEYDSVAMTLEIKIINTSTEHKIYTNGEVKNLDTNHFLVTYPDYFTASSVFFHLSNMNKFREIKFNFKSVSGKSFPVTIYSGNDQNDEFIYSYKEEAINVLTELEAWFGAWPHPKFLIYASGSGGMEYCGATVTSLSALGHETTHNFVGRHALPNMGNDGWIDEALARWRDREFKHFNRNELISSNLGGHSPHMRETDDNAYDHGSRLFGYLDLTQGKLKDFFRQFFTKYSGRHYTTSDLKSELEQNYNQSFNELFNKVIYGKSGTIENLKNKNNYNPNHPRLSKEELLKLL